MENESNPPNFGNMIPHMIVIADNVPFAGWENLASIVSNKPDVSTVQIERQELRYPDGTVGNRVIMNVIGVM